MKEASCGSISTPSRHGVGKDRRGCIPNQVLNSAEVETRDRQGADQDSDLISGARHKQAIVTMVDRSTRYIKMTKGPFNTAEKVQNATCSIICSVKRFFKTCSIDNRRDFT